MKKFQSITIMILLSAVIFSMAMSCSESDNKSAGTTTKASNPNGDTVTEEINPIDLLPETDLEGFTLSMLHYDNSWLSWAQNILDSETIDGDLLNDSVYERNLFIKEKYNCEISITAINNPTTMIAGLATSGDSSYDVVFIYDLDVLKHIDYLMKWNDIPYIDLSADWWNPDATSLFEIGGKQVAVCGDFSISVLSRAAGYVFNKDIYALFMLEEDMYEMVRNDTWTIDQMYDIAKMAISDLNGDGVFDINDRYGIASNLKEHYSRLLEGSGIQYIKKDSDGYPEFTLPSDEIAIAKMLRIIEMNRNEPNIFKFDPASQHNGPAGDLFKNSKVLFSAAPVFSIENMRDVEFEVGVLPVPKYDEKQDRYYAPSFGAEIQTMLRSFDISRAESVGLLLEAMSIHSHYNLVQTYKEVMLKTKYSRDNESEDMLDIIFTNIWFEFGINAWQNTVASPMFDKVFMTLNDTLLSSLASMESTVNAEIEKLITGIENME